MWPILFEWNGSLVYSYPFFIGLSWGLGFRLAEAQLPRELPQRYFMWWMVGLFLFSWVGAKLLFIFTQDRWSMSELASASNFWLGGGFVFLGGLLGGGCFTLLASRTWSFLSLERMQFVIAPLLWGHALGRVGCFLAGCCFGKESDVPWAITMHGHARHPTQLYEALALAVLAYLVQRRCFKSYQTQGYLISYGIVRWIIENFRGDELRGAWGAQSTSQWIALGMITAGSAWLAVQIREKTHRPAK